MPYVRYKIVAYDNIGNTAKQDNSEEYYIYYVTQSSLHGCHFSLFFS